LINQKEDFLSKIKLSLWRKVLKNLKLMS